MEHSQQWRIIFVNEHHDLLAIFLVAAFDETFQTVAGLVADTLNAILLFKPFQLRTNAKFHIVNTLALG